MDSLEHHDMVPKDKARGLIMKAKKKKQSDNLWKIYCILKRHISKFQEAEIPVWRDQYSKKKDIRRRLGKLISFIVDGQHRSKKKVQRMVKTLDGRVRTKEEHIKVLNSFDGNLGPKMTLSVSLYWKTRKPVAQWWEAKHARVRFRSVLSETDIQLRIQVSFEFTVCT